MNRIAINGFGRIGRQTFRRIVETHPRLKVVAINDLTDNKTLAHLFKYDSLYGIYNKEIGFDEKGIIIEGEHFSVFSETDPERLPWKESKIDIVLECTGFFTEYEKAQKHLKSGAKKVIISAPSSSKEVPTYILGVNEEKYNPEKEDIISNSSCTTNCLAPIVKILQDEFSIESGFMTTVHSYTNDQRILDLPHKDLRRARAANLSIIPTTTGAAKSVAQVIPGLIGKLDGFAFRVPTPTVSIIDFVAKVKNIPKNKEEVNNLFREKVKEKKLSKIINVEDNPLVSVDFKGNPFSAIIDSELTMVINDLIKIVAWYDNEWGYSCRLAEMAEYVAERL